MRLTVLVDNNTINDKYYFGEPAVCYYIEDGNHKILFDVGYSDIFKKNARLMNINIDEIDSIVISHGHEDHSNGLKYYLDDARKRKIKLYSHPLAFNKKKLNSEMICSPYSYDLLNDYFNIRTSEKPINISKNIIFLGQIPTILDFEKRESMGNIKIDGVYKSDYLYDDSAIVYKGSKGIFIITGCSHSGICNIIEYAKKVCKTTKVIGVLGGFHLIKDDEKLNKTIEYFSKNKINNIYPCHCTSLLAKSRFISKLNKKVKEVGVGLKLNIK